MVRNPGDVPAGKLPIPDLPSARRALEACERELAHFAAGEVMVTERLLGGSSAERQCEVEAVAAYCRLLLGRDT